MSARDYAKLHKKYTMQELVEFAKLARAGDKVAAGKLISGVIPTLLTCIGRGLPGGTKDPQFDDMMQDIMTELADKIKYYDERKGRLMGFIFTVVSNRLRYVYLNGLARSKRADAAASDDGARQLHVPTPTPEDELEEKQTRFKRETAVLDGIKTLDDRENFILIRRFYYDETLEDLSKKLGVSRERVRQIEVRAFEKIRGFVNECDKRLARSAS